MDLAHSRPRSRPHPQDPLLLDLSRDDVADFIWTTLNRLLSSYRIGI